MESSSTDFSMEMISSSFLCLDGVDLRPSPAVSSSIDAFNAFAMSCSNKTVGGFLPRSILEIVSHAQPTRSASCPWVRPLPMRAARTLSPMVC